MATQQAILAEEAMERMETGARSLYDFRPPMQDALRAEIAALNDEIDSAGDDALRTQAEALYARYLAVPAEERSYVSAFARLRAALEETGRTLEPEDPAAAYDLRLPTEPSASGSGIVWVAGGAAAVLLLGSGVIVWMRKRKCTK